LYERLPARRLLDLACRFPALVIVGARQVGKTTLARAVFRGAIDASPSRA